MCTSHGCFSLITESSLLPLVKGSLVAFSDNLKRSKLSVLVEIVDRLLVGRELPVQSVKGPQAVYDVSAGDDTAVTFRISQDFIERVVLYTSLSHCNLLLESASPL